MNNDNKPVVLLVGAIAALAAISLVVRFVALSELGVSGSWMLLFALPAAGVGGLVLLLRLGVLNSGRGFSFLPTTGSAPTKSQRLHEIEQLRSSGAMSEDEYTAQRARIISSI
jgi:hypothetical protein